MPTALEIATKVYALFGEGKIPEIGELYAESGSVTWMGDRGKEEFGGGFMGFAAGVLSRIPVEWQGFTIQKSDKIHSQKSDKSPTPEILQSPIAIELDLAGENANGDTEQTWNMIKTYSTNSTDYPNLPPSKAMAKSSPKLSLIHI